jgi:hypothetical protein
VSSAARMANVPESEIIRRLVAANALAKEDPEPDHKGVAIYADHADHRVRARYFEPARVEIVDGPLAGAKSTGPRRPDRGGGTVKNRQQLRTRRGRATGIPAPVRAADQSGPRRRASATPLPRDAAVHHERV